MGLKYKANVHFESDLLPNYEYLVSGVSEFSAKV